MKHDFQSNIFTNNGYCHRSDDMRGCFSGGPSSSDDPPLSWGEDGSALTFLPDSCIWRACACDRGIIRFCKLVVGVNPLGVRDIPEACTAAVSGPGIPSPPVNADPKSLARSALFICKSVGNIADGRTDASCVLGVAWEI